MEDDWIGEDIKLLTMGLTLSIYLKVLFLGAEQQRLPAAGDVGHTGQEQEGWMVGEDVVEEPEPLLTSKNF